MSIEKPAIEADMHCHTIASSHAYNTILEMAQHAAKVGLKAIAITDHAQAMPGGAHPWYFSNMTCLPDRIEGVRVYHGVEANITDFDGSLDLDRQIQRKLDWVIASFHDVVILPGSIEQHTACYLKLAENPYVDVIGHSGRGGYDFDVDKVIPVLKKAGKLIEINNHSLDLSDRAHKSCKEIALACKKVGAPVVVNTDSHCCFELGMVDGAMELLRSIDFPEELIMNLTLERLNDWLFNKRRKTAI